MINNNTICAIATPAGVGGIAVIRVSGENAFEICDKIFVSENGNKIADFQANTIHFGKIVSEQRTKNKEQRQENTFLISHSLLLTPHSSFLSVIDEVLVSVFHAPHSFTGENIVEISAHGSIFVQQKILKLLLQNGCRLAQAGEFTQRAFLNGKMDLAQAEAVADLISSTSAAAHRLAMNQMRGGISCELQNLRSQLLDFASLIELELDFSEEDVEFADRKNLIDLSKKICKKLSDLTNSFDLGNAVKNGITVAIAGKTNVGKSSLLNFLLNEEKAIVSNIHGTTRDIIEDCVNIQGVMFRFIDTAGIRHTENEIEKIGIERAFKQIEKAQIVLYVVDCTEFDSPQITPINTDKIICDNLCNLCNLWTNKAILVFNKIDLINNDKIQIINELYKDFDCPKIFVSLKEKINTEKLIDEILKAANISQLSENDVIITNVRHRDALQKSLDAVERVIAGLQSGISTDFISQDIRECLHFLGEITGEITTNEILGNIFGKFCIGK